MPIRVNNNIGVASRAYETPFVGTINHSVAISVALSGLTAAEIDAKGYVKPGLPLAKDGTLVGVGEKVFGVTIEEVKVADDNATATIAALGTQDIAVATICQVNQDVVEDMLGRALTADEIAGFVGTPCVLI